MKYKNDFAAAVRYLNLNGNSYTPPSGILIDKINRIAADCMAAYDPNLGDRELVGWVPFTALTGAATETLKGRDVDGVCFFGRDGRAVIGIAQSVLDMDLPQYARASVGLHEVAHLSEDKHNDRFVSILSELQRRYFEMEQQARVAAQPSYNGR